MKNNPKLQKYLQESMINNKLCRFNKNEIAVFVTQISAKIEDYQKLEYMEIVRHAADIWNKYSPVKFIFTEQKEKADIVVIWTKAGITFEGMCKFRSIVNSEIRSVTIEIGLPNPNSPKIVNNATILHTALHEFGHALGLGHGTDENDLMFVPHQKTLNLPSENDISILNFLYSNKIGQSYNNLIQ